MLNGSPTGNFNSNRGIRQDDPLSPYLFVLVMEFWSISMDISVASGIIAPMNRSSPILVSRLFFADDMLVFCKGDLKSAKEFNSMLKQLELFTGLSANKSKCTVYFS